VRAQHPLAALRRDEQGVLHLARRVVPAEVEGVEVEPLVLDLGPSATSQPMATKTSQMRSWIVVSGWRAPAGSRSGSSVTSTASSTSTRASRSSSSTRRRSSSALPMACETALTRLAGLGTVGAGQRAERLARSGQRAPVADQGGLEGLQRRQVRGAGQGRERVVPDPVQRGLGVQVGRGGRGRGGAGHGCSS
jgi:hypothetical protein